MKSLLLIIFFALLFVKTFASLPDVQVKDGPFWLKRPQVLERISERDILVSVKSIDGKEGEDKSLEMQGVGLVHKSADQSFEIAKKFQNLEKVSSHVKKIEYDEAKRQLFMHSEAFNYHAKMWMKVDFVEEDKKKQIRFFIEKGVFAGMRGSISFLNTSANKSRIEFLSLYDYQKLPVPAFFVEFGLEVIIQKVAAKMRTFIETYKVQEKTS